VSETIHGRATARQKLWITHDGPLRVLRPEYRDAYLDIFKKLEIELFLKPSDPTGNCSWTKEEALKYGFIFRRSRDEQQFRSIYSIIYKTSEEYSSLYVGKNANTDRNVNTRRRNLTSHDSKNNIEASTPNEEMCNFLESIFIMCYALGSILGLEQTGGQWGLDNYFNEPVQSVPVGIDTKEYIHVVFRLLFKSDLIIGQETELVDNLIEALSQMKT